jgi:metal-sulfur cluster biosynthetic enzyme
MTPPPVTNPVAAAATARQPGDRHGHGSQARADTAGADTASVLAALAGVRDPELDEPITSLGFVTSCTVSDGGEIRVRLRLPTYFCAPNFAFLMVADSYDAVAALPQACNVVIELADHFASDAINHGVAARAGFVASFDGEAAGELHQLRADFLRKAVLAGTDRLCRLASADGAGPSALASLTLGEVPPSAERERLRQRRAELGLPSGDGSPLVIDPVTGDGVSAEALPLHLRRAHTTRISVEANAGICRGMLRHRYGTTGLGEEDT